MLATSRITFVTSDPAWPWSVPGVGLVLLATVAMVLLGLTVWTYRGVGGAKGSRVAILIGLRLAALLVACLMVLRPSLALREDAHLPSTLIVAADQSESMTIQDQHDNLARWEYLRRVLKDCEPELQQLRDVHNVTVVLSRFAEGVDDFDPLGKADGKRTDFGEMLHALYDRHGSERYLRGLLVLSDGADNGSRYPALAEANKWRSLPCPIHTFAFGKSTTTAKHRDIALTAINSDPSPVPVKGKLTVRGIVDAPGFEGRTVRLRLFVDDREVLADDVKLVKTTANEVKLIVDAPALAGEIKVTLKIDPLEGEVTQANNEISTYVTVTKEGISVLYVEGKYRSWEPKFIRYALGQEPTIRLFEAVRLTDDAPPPGEADLFQFEKQHYDVIILGDITARRLSAGDARALTAINKLVSEKGVGLMMIGGYESFANSDWENTDIAKLLPVELDATGQIDAPIQMVPAREGMRHYLLRLSEREADNNTLWNKLPKLDGMTKLGRPKPGALVFAESTTGQPILVGLPSYGKGRTLAFAGDTTWRWRRTEDGLVAHARFWRQLVLWLARRDEADGNVIVVPDTRRMAAGGKLGFAVRLRGKGGVDIPEKDAHFEVTVKGPEGVETKVPTAREHGDERGTFWKTDMPGEYVIVATGRGTDTDGKPLENLAPAQARFVVYRDEAEMTRQAADHDFLRRLANAGGGAAHQPEELKQFLKSLGNLPLPQSRPKTKLWPDWRRTPPSDRLRDQVAALSSSGILASFLVFVTLLCLEWGLRRYWGFV
jgi:uncharacterized membrane protein